MVQIIRYSKFFEDNSKNYFKDKIDWKFLNSIIYVCTPYEDKAESSIDISVFVTESVPNIKINGAAKVKVYDNVKGFIPDYDLPLISANEYYEKNGLFYRIRFKDGNKHINDFDKICERLSAIYKIEILVKSIRTCYIRPV